MGKLIVLEGLDGSGKATQTALLAQALAERSVPVRAVSFPAYDSPSSALVKMYLSGAFGSKPGDVNPYAASAFYAVDRYAGFKTDWGQDWMADGIVVADRYTTSNAIHQCAKLPPGEWAAYANWLEDFEYGKMGIPKPDLVIYLDVDPAVSQRLLQQRYGGDDAKKDIHERDVAYLAAARQAALWCVETLGWRYLPCNDGDGMRDRRDIAEKIIQIVEDVL